MFGLGAEVIWAGALIFARIGSALMLLPAWGEGAVPARLRLSVALVAALALAPVLGGRFGPQPTEILPLAGILISEILIGLIIGASARLFMSALAVAGSVAGMTTGLSFAQQLDPTAQENGATIGVFLGLTGVVLLFASGLHLALFRAAAESYALLPAGEAPLAGDAAELILSSASAAFELGVTIAAPVLAFALVFNMAIGVVARLIPQIQVFFIALPASVLLGMAVLALGVGAGMQAWLAAVEAFTGQWL